MIFSYLHKKSAHLLHFCRQTGGFIGAISFFFGCFCFCGELKFLIFSQHIKLVFQLCDPVLKLLLFFILSLFDLGLSCDIHAVSSRQYADKNCERACQRIEPAFLFGCGSVDKLAYLCGFQCLFQCDRQRNGDNYRSDSIDRRCDGIVSDSRPCSSKQSSVCRQEL